MAARAEREAEWRRAGSKKMSRQVSLSRPSSAAPRNSSSHSKNSASAMHSRAGAAATQQAEADEVVHIWKAASGSHFTLRGAHLSRVTCFPLSTRGSARRNGPDDARHRGRARPPRARARPALRRFRRARGVDHRAPPRAPANHVDGRRGAFAHPGAAAEALLGHPRATTSAVRCCGRSRSWRCSLRSRSRVTGGADGSSTRSDRGERRPPSLRPLHPSRISCRRRPDTRPPGG
jgi:hypothetical protein